MTARVTRVGQSAVAAKSSYKSKRGNEYELRDLTFFECMEADSLATDEQGMPSVMKIPYIRALCAIVSLNGEPFGPIRSKIDVVKWGGKLPAADSEGLLEHLRNAEALTPEQVKNE